jgi:hypothetical protein
MVRRTDTGQFVEPDGEPLMVTNRPVSVLMGEHSGVTIYTNEETQLMAKKAERDGIYVLNGRHFKARAGKPLPDGATMLDAPEARSKGIAPENRKLDAAPENRSKTSKKDDNA